MKFPVFPLNGAVLFPQTNLPLNIFESRYIDMVDYSLSNNRLIGMIQKRKNDKMFEIGCLGKITHFSEKADGRYEINLEGLYCYKILKTITNYHKFIIVEAEALDIKKNLNDMNIKDSLLSNFERYLGSKNLQLKLNQFYDLDLVSLSKVISILSPLDHLVKQMLLEIDNEKEFCEKLIAVLDIEAQNHHHNAKIN